MTGDVIRFDNGIKFIAEVFDESRSDWTEFDVDMLAGDPAIKCRSRMLTGPGENSAGQVVGASLIPEAVIANTAQNDEWMLIVDGEARMKFEDGTEVDLMPGVLLHIPAGSSSVCSVRKPLKEIFFGTM